jgi:hypothetical protein
MIENFELSDFPYAEFARSQFPQSVRTLDMELFKLVEMARLWVREHNYPPYKLALQADISTSQCHKMMDPSWNPSVKLLRKIAAALPSDWVRAFELDANISLPRVFSTPYSNAIDHSTVDRIETDLRFGHLDAAGERLDAQGLSFREFDFSDSDHIKVMTFYSTAPDPTVDGISISLRNIPPVYPEIPPSGSISITQFLEQRKPFNYFGRHYVTTMSLIQTEDRNKVRQYWKANPILPFSSQRQKDLFELYSQYRKSKRAG